MDYLGQLILLFWYHSKCGVSLKTSYTMFSVGVRSAKWIERVVTEWTRRRISDSRYRYPAFETSVRYHHLTIQYDTLYLKKYSQKTFIFLKKFFKNFYMMKMPGLNHYEDKQILSGWRFDPVTVGRWEVQYYPYQPCHNHSAPLTNLYITYFAE